MNSFIMLFAGAFIAAGIAAWNFNILETAETRSNHLRFVGSSDESELKKLKRKANAASVIGAICVAVSLGLIVAGLIIAIGAVNR